MGAPRDERRDADCFARLVRGDRSALGDLYDMHAASLFRHRLALTLKPGEAEDLVQTKIECSFVDCQKVPPGGQAIEGPLKVPFEEKTPPAPSEGVVWALKNQLK